jgi:hypothetical protein
MNANQDINLRRRFAALREHDSRNEPDFETVRNRASLRPADAARFAPGVRWIAAAACVVIAAALGIGIARHGKTARTASPVPAISSWQSPTAGLLQAPSTSVLVSRPLLSSVFDGVAAPLQIKTD